MLPMSQAHCSDYGRQNLFSLKRIFGLHIKSVSCRITDTLHEESNHFGSFQVSHLHKQTFRNNQNDKNIYVWKFATLEMNSNNRFFHILYYR